MHKIFLKIKEIISDSINKYLPDISLDKLENNGAIFYMNGKNGTEFDWYVNDKLSDFMVFYDDEDNMGAIKATLYNKGDLLLYVYGEHGQTMVQEIKTYIDVKEEELLTLATTLRCEADDKRIWDADIESINTDSEPVDDKIEEFKQHAPYYEESRQRKLMLGQVAYVSKKIMEEGRKIGYMRRDESLRDGDSGWSFMAGDEDEEYINDYNNIALMSIYSVAQYDWAIMKHITSPAGSSFVRVSENEFEPDEPGKKIYGI